MADPYKFYPCIARTGGAGSLQSGDLTSDGDNLEDLDAAIVQEFGTMIPYTLDADSGAAHDGVNVIAPLTNAGTKRWLLQGM